MKLSQVALAAIHEEKLSKAVLSQVVENAEKRSDSTQRLKHQHLNFESPYLVPFTVIGTRRKLDNEDRKCNTQKQKRDP
uniref:Uncharacterized protein n=1 Tax=Rhizophora mucronata TaxID=61149 RepID=A0A2P2PQH9_RHIMU